MPGDPTQRCRSRHDVTNNRKKKTTKGKQNHINDRKKGRGSKQDEKQSGGFAGKAEMNKKMEPKASGRSKTSLPFSCVFYSSDQRNRKKKKTFFQEKTNDKKLQFIHHTKQGCVFFFISRGFRSESRISAMRI